MERSVIRRRFGECVRSVSWENGRVIKSIGVLWPVWGLGARPGGFQRETREEVDGERPGEGRRERAKERIPGDDENAMETGRELRMVLARPS